MTFFVDFKVRKSPVFALRKYGAFLMITRILYSKIWKDEFFAGLNPTEKLLFVYFIACENNKPKYVWIIPRGKFYKRKFRSFSLTVGKTKNLWVSFEKITETLNKIIPL